MTIHIRINASNSRRTRFTMIINRRNRGQLCLPTDIVKPFLQVIENGTGCGRFETFKVSGKLFDPCGEPRPKRRCRR